MNDDTSGRHLRDSGELVLYPDKETQVMLGDVVETRVWFRKYLGRVVYVPGVSELNPEMERDGLQWVGVRLDRGGFVAKVIDPVEKYILKSLKLIRRSNEGYEKLRADEDPFGDDSFASP